MHTSIEMFLSQQGILPEETVYRDELETVRQFPLIIGDALSFKKKEGTNLYFAASYRFRESMERKQNQTEYRCFVEAIEKVKEIQAFLEELNAQKDGHQYQAGIRFVRAGVKTLKERQRELENLYQAESSRECFGTNKPLSESIIWYKDILCLTSVNQMAYAIKELRQIEIGEIKRMPLFTSRPAGLKAALEGGEPLGIEGGPCLFGSDEVIIKIVHKSGQEFYFDYSDPKNYEMNGMQGDEDKIVCHLEHYGSEVAAIDFINKKKGITAAEYESLLYVFEFARVLGAKAVIPIPDMSYRKYLAAVCQKVDSEVARQAELLFRHIVYEITDMYLVWIGKLQERYREVTVAVFHERNREFCSLFYEKRNEYFSRYKQKDAITSNACKREAVLDYVTMPALPFYKWGIREVIQIDCISEADSYRKCGKIHGKDLRLHGILYAERLSRDGKHSIFSAENRWKEYMLP